MNLPNGLTLMRIFLVPLLVAVLLTKYNVLIAAAIFLAASLTDLLDGYFARKGRRRRIAQLWPRVRREKSNRQIPRGAQTGRGIQDHGNGIHDN